MNIPGTAPKTGESAKQTTKVQTVQTSEENVLSDRVVQEGSGEVSNHTAGSTAEKKRIGNKNAGRV